FSEKGTQKEKNEIFNASIRVHFLFSIIAFILLQTIGQILFYYFLNIPEGKLHSAQIAYQCVIFIFFFNIISVPFQAAINSYEDMDVLAKAGVIDSVLKLLAAYSLSYFNYNRLEIYSSMFLLITIIINFYYFYYCRINYKDAVIGLSPVKKSTYIQLTSFASWTVFGSFASLIRKQGSVILLNM